MKRLLLLLALVISVVVTAAPALADGDFYVVAVGGGVGTKITSLPYEIKNPGFYYLSGNLTYSGENYAIWIAANNVTLDLMGFSLTSNVAEAQGIEIHPYRSNVEIRNGTVNGFYNGINAFLGSGTPPPTITASSISGPLATTMTVSVSKAITTWLKAAMPLIMVGPAFFWGPASLPAVRPLITEPLAFV